MSARVCVPRWLKLCDTTAASVRTGRLLSSRHGVSGAVSLRRRAILGRVEPDHGDRLHCLSGFVVLHGRRVSAERCVRARLLLRRRVGGGATKRVRSRHVLAKYGPQRGRRLCDVPSGGVLRRWLIDANRLFLGLLLQCHWSHRWPMYAIAGRVVLDRQCHRSLALRRRILLGRRRISVPRVRDRRILSRQYVAGRHAIGSVHVPGKHVLPGRYVDRANAGCVRVLERAVLPGWRNGTHKLLGGHVPAGDGRVDVPHVSSRVVLC